MQDLLKCKDDNQELQDFGKYVELLDKTFAQLEAVSSDNARTEQGMEILNVLPLLIESILGALDLTAALMRYQMVDHRGRALKLIVSLNSPKSFLSTGPSFRKLDIQEVSSRPFHTSLSGPDPLSCKCGILSRSLMTSQTNPGIGIDLRHNLNLFLGMHVSTIGQKVQKDAKHKKRIHAEIQLIFHYEKPGNSFP